MHSIISDLTYLKQPCENIKSLDEAKKIADELFNILASSKNGVGLAANQIGINKAVCVINVWRPIWLMNPSFTPNNDIKIKFDEGCLSFPDTIVTTERYKNITVTADNHKEKLHFGPWNMLECVCIQHEIGHLNGETMFDYKI